VNDGATLNQLTTIALACVAMSASAIVIAQDSAAQNPVRGKQLYYDHGCYGCHGFNGETGVRRLVGTGSSILESSDAFVAFLRLRADARPLLPSASMPSYPITALSDADARDIYAYVYTFVLHAPDPKTIGTLQTLLDSAKVPYKSPP
jgi:mono/diheme cytochrome c family protein